MRWDDGSRESTSGGEGRGPGRASHCQTHRKSCAAPDTCSCTSAESTGRWGWVSAGSTSTIPLPSLSPSLSPLRLPFAETGCSANANGGTSSDRELRRLIAGRGGPMSRRACSAGMRHHGQARAGRSRRAGADACNGAAGGNGELAP